MAITPLPAVPLRSDAPATFVTKADAFLGALNLFATEVDAVGVALTLGATNSTSVTSLLIGVGSKSLTVQTGKSYVAGMTLKIASTASPSNWMLGDITSYVTGTGALVINITSILGAGTVAAWTISQSAPGGASIGANSDITSLTGLTTPLAVAYGGIGSATSAGAPFAIKGANSDITSLTGLTTALSVLQGGTGVTTSTGTGNNVLSASPTFTGNTTASFVRGEFRKDAPSAVAFVTTAAFAVSTQTPMYIDVNGTCLTFASGVVVSMPSAVTGTDYAIWAETAGTLTCTNNHTTPPTANAR